LKGAKVKESLKKHLPDKFKVAFEAPQAIRQQEDEENAKMPVT
jgi:hypothetical protein